jgi:hypothetical protein
MITWKSVLNDYIRDSNRMEVEHSIDGLRMYVIDHSYLRAQANRLERLSEQYGDRYRRVQRTETRARLIDSYGQDRQIVATIRINKKWMYDHGVEREQVEHERITMIFRRGQWVIAKIDAEWTEKNASPVLLSELNRYRSSQPYINRNILTNRSDSYRAIHYNRQHAVNYANEWWNKANPNYHHFDVDCTNFVSQCLFAGGIPMNYTGKRESGWWYEGYDQGRERWSFSWAVANSLQLHMQSSRSGLRAVTVDSARKLVIGDIISYDWDGDTKFQHTAIVTAIDASGEPLVNAHTNDSRHRFWDYRDSYAWTERTRYTFLHIPDTL